MNRSVKRVVPFAVAVVLVLVGIFGPVLVRSGWTGEETGAAESVETARKSAEEAKGEHRASQAVEVKAASGYDLDRMEQDEKVLHGLLSTMCTWSSQDTYEKARQALMGEYGVAEDSKLLSDFMPFIAHDSVNGRGQTLSGSNIIDAQGLNMSLGDVKYYLSGIDGDRYSYVCRFEMVSSAGGRSHGIHGLLTCSVDSSGNVFDVQGER